MKTPSSSVTETIDTVKDRAGRFIPRTIESSQDAAKGFLPKFMKLAGKLPFADDLAAAYYCAMDPLTSMKTKTVLFGAIAYFVLPTDAIPDMILGLGFADDATVLATAIATVGTSIKQTHRAAARKLLRQPEPVADTSQ